MLPAATPWVVNCPMLLGVFATELTVHPSGRFTSKRAMYSSSGEEAVTLKHRSTGAPGDTESGVTALTVEPLILASAGAATNTSDKNNTNANGNVSATTKPPSRFVNIHFLLEGCLPLLRRRRSKMIYHWAQQAAGPGYSYREILL